MTTPTYGVTAAMLEAEVAGLDLTNFVPTPAGASRAITRAGARVAGLIESLGEDAATVEADTTGILYQRCQELVVLRALGYLLSVREGGVSDQGRALDERADRLTQELRDFPGSLGSERSTAYTSQGTTFTETSRSTEWAQQRQTRTQSAFRTMLDRGER